jgi:Putative Flp pilus-assembly TadE/G-like
MHNLLRCRRGTVAFVTVVALVPLIGVVALGGEAGSWYVTKQHGQNAADAAAYSGGLILACQLSGNCADPQSVVYRGKEFAAQNGFCNAGDTSYPDSRCGTLPTGISQTVQINQLTSWNGINGDFVQAVVQQTQPTYLARILGIPTVNIGATAVAQVKQTPANPCILALTGSISFQGSPNINAPSCGMASNDRNTDALNFTGGGMSLNLGSLSAAGGCTGTASFCGNALTYLPPVVNPFSALDGVTMPALPDCTLPKKDSSGNIALVAYSAATPCANNVSKLQGGSTGVTMNGGVYFLSGSSLNGGQSITGTGLLIPLGSVNLKGSSSINVTANTSVTASQLPPVLQPYASLFDKMAIYDRNSTAWSIGGTSRVTFTGNMYLPNAAVTLQGNPSGTASTCEQLVAASLAFNGNATFDNTGCSAGTKPTSQYVQLVS